MPKAQTTIQTSELIDHLKSLGPAAAGGEEASLSLKRERGKDLLLRASNGEFGTRASLGAGGAGILDIQVPHKALLQLAGAAGDTIALAEDGDQLVLKSGNRTLKLEKATSKPFVFSPLANGEEVLASIPGDVLIDALPKAVRCAAEDAARPVLNSVALFDRDNGLHLVSTDSYRLVVLPLGVESKETLSEPLLLPYAAAKALAADLKRRKPEEVELFRFSSPGEGGAIVRYSGVEWVLRGVSGKFPEYEQLIPEKGNDLLLDRGELRNVLDGVEAIGAKRRRNGNSNSALRLDLGQTVAASYSQPGVGTLEEEMPDSLWEGEETAAGFNPAFLRDLLRIMDGSEGKLQGRSEGAMKPALFKDDEGRRYLLMPIRLTDMNGNGAG
jgi:DNA polymerase III sliding clamp (beta) subunit (PCNA family)